MEQYFRINEKKIKELVKKIDEKNYIYTHLNLCNDMINSLPNLNCDILVIRNIEYVYVLHLKGINMSNVYYSTNCETKKKIAIHLGVNENNISNLQYNNKDIFVNFKMKFDVVIQNPPYNPNSIWKKFVELGISLLKDEGHMAIIHPSDWRDSSKHEKLCLHLKEHISELHINDFEIWKEQKVATRTDWYVYSKQKITETIVFYPSNDIVKFNLKNYNKILRISPNNIAFSILEKLTNNKLNGVVLQGRTGYHPLYKKHDNINGIYRQCGTEGKGTNWTTGDFSLTTEPNENQFLNKVVMSYCGKPRAQYFSSDENIGVVRANFWITDNKSLPILLNSKMLWKLICKIVDPDKNMYKPYGTMAGIPNWFLEKLNFDNLNVSCEQELYDHYRLTQEEIDWIEND